MDLSRFSYIYYRSLVSQPYCAPTRPRLPSYNGTNFMYKSHQVLWRKWERDRERAKVIMRAWLCIQITLSSRRPCLGFWKIDCINFRPWRLQPQAFVLLSPPKWKPCIANFQTTPTPRTHFALHFRSHVDPSPLLANYCVYFLELIIDFFVSIFRLLSWFINNVAKGKLRRPRV